MRNRPLLMSLGAILATTAIGVGATFALFSDSKDVTGTITAGTLCIDSSRDAFDTTPGPMFYMTAAQGMTPTGQFGKYPTAEVSLNSPPGYVPPTPGGWAPGDQVTRTLTVFPKRMNCLDEKVTKIWADWHPGVTNYEAMADKMYVTVKAQPIGGGAFVTVAQGYLREFLPLNRSGGGGKAVMYPSGFNPVMPNWTSGPQPNLQMDFTVKFDLDTPNDYQDKTIIVDFYLKGRQDRNTPNPFPEGPVNDTASEIAN
jgi:predicted ribosomally synthesized peptide with SipW-like signal peptide